ncbi:polycomb group protein ASXL1 [Callorhinchus milii]|uniref:polycomb group protein ASXL1 n=1 Tax=Callorhinchus milii TaxID=7868 RepID=UPI001C3FB397|nr:polycomb group protein ASXL1 [Callorhinchus milii]
MKDKQQQQQKKKKDRTWAEAARMVLENYSDAPMTPKQILHVIETERLKEMRSGTSPLACLNAMLHTNSRADDGMFYRLPGRMGLYTLKKDALLWSKNIPIGDGEGYEDGPDLESCDSNETSTTGEENDVSPGSDETSSNASCSTEVQAKQVSPGKHGSHKAAQQSAKQQPKKKIGVPVMMSKSIPRVVLTPLKVNGEHVESASAFAAKHTDGESSSALSSSSCTVASSAAQYSRAELSKLQCRPGLSRKPGQHFRNLRRSSTGQMKRNRGEEIDVETPGSILVNTNLRALINSRTFASLPLHFQQQLLFLLPDVDQQVGNDGTMRLCSSALNNEFFTSAAQGWKQRLAEGEFTPEMQLRLRQEMEKEKKVEQWKEKFFEDYYGQRLGLSKQDLEQQTDCRAGVGNAANSQPPHKAGPSKQPSPQHRPEESLRKCTRSAKAELKCRVKRAVLKETELSPEPQPEPQPKPEPNESADVSLPSRDSRGREKCSQEVQVIEPPGAARVNKSEPCPERNREEAIPSKSDPDPKPAPEKPVVSQERPERDPEPVSPRPVSPQPEPVSRQPEPVSRQPEPVSPEPVSPQPEPVSLQPVSLQPVSLQPVSLKPVSLQPEPVSLQPEPVSLKPVSLQPEPERIDGEPERSGERVERSTGQPASLPRDQTTCLSARAAAWKSEPEHSCAEAKEQKRKSAEPSASTSGPEKKPRLDEHQSFRTPIDSFRTEREQPTREEPKVPPIRIQLSRIKPPWVVKGQPAYQIRPRIVSPAGAGPGGGGGGSRERTGARTLADIKARAQQARAQREAASAAAASGGGLEGEGEGAGGDGGGAIAHPDGRTTAPEPSVAQHQPGAQLRQAGASGSTEEPGIGRSADRKQSVVAEDRDPARYSVLAADNDDDRPPGPECDVPLVVSPTNTVVEEEEEEEDGNSGRQTLVLSLSQTDLRVQTPDSVDLSGDGFLPETEETPCQATEPSIAVTITTATATPGSSPSSGCETDAPSSTDRPSLPSAPPIESPEAEGGIPGPGMVAPSPPEPVETVAEGSRCCSELEECDRLEAGTLGESSSGPSLVEQRAGTSVIVSASPPAKGKLPAPGEGAVKERDTEQRQAEEEGVRPQTEPSVSLPELGPRERLASRVLQRSGGSDTDQSHAMRSQLLTGSFPRHDLGEGAMDHARGPDCPYVSDSAESCPGFPRLSQEGPRERAPDPTSTTTPQPYPAEAPLLPGADGHRRPGLGGLGSSRPLSSVEANNPLVTQLLQGSLPLEKVLPLSNSSTKLEITRLAGPPPESPPLRPEPSPGQTDPRGGDESTELHPHKAPARESRDIIVQKRPELIRQWAATLPRKPLMQTRVVLERESRSHGEGFISQEQLNRALILSGAVEESGVRGPQAVCGFENGGKETGLKGPLNTRGPGSQRSGPETLKQIGAVTGYYVPSGRLDGTRNAIFGSVIAKARGYPHLAAHKDGGFRVTEVIKVQSKGPGAEHPEKLVGLVGTDCLPALALRRDWLPRLREGFKVIKTEGLPACRGMSKSQDIVSLKGGTHFPLDPKDKLRLVSSVQVDSAIGKAIRESGLQFQRSADCSPTPSPFSVQQQLYGKLPKLSFSSTGFSHIASASVSELSAGSFPASIAGSMMSLSQKANFASHNSALSGQTFAGNTSVEEMTLKCSCRLKAMIMCKGCGAFCHDDCIGPSKLCVSCLVVR